MLVPAAPAPQAIPVTRPTALQALTLEADTVVAIAEIQVRR